MLAPTLRSSQQSAPLGYGRHRVGLLRAEIDAVVDHHLPGHRTIAPASMASSPG